MPPPYTPISQYNGYNGIEGSYHTDLCDSKAQCKSMHLPPIPNVLIEAAQ